MIETISYQQEKAEAFGGQLIAALNTAATVQLMGVGYQAGLFEALAGREPSTSEEIARATNFSERYVREWLGGMVVSGIVEYAPETRRYHLPREHATSLTAAGGLNNLAPLTQLGSVLSKAEPHLLEAFRTGAGIPYTAFENFQDIMYTLSQPFIDGALLESVLPLAGVKEQLEAGSDVLEVGCGAGHAVNVLAKAFPNSRFTGIDLAPEGIEAAKAEAGRLGLTNVRFEAGSAEALQASGEYDFAYCLDVIHDLARPDKVLHGVWSALRPGGVFLAAEPAASSRLEENLEHPLGAFQFAASIYHCMSVGIAQGGEGLGGMIGDETIARLIQEAGFGKVEAKHIEGDFVYTYHVARKS